VPGRPNQILPTARPEDVFPANEAALRPVPYRFQDGRVGYRHENTAESP